MNRRKLAISLLGVLTANLEATLTNFAEPVGPDAETRDERAPWKIRLYGANKDRRAARKKRAKRLRR